MLAVRPALGQQRIGVPAVDGFMSTTPGKLVTAGVIGVAAAKAFPGKTLAPFGLGAFLALALGLVQDVPGGPR